MSVCHTCDEFKWDIFCEICPHEDESTRTVICEICFAYNATCGYCKTNFCKKHESIPDVCTNCISKEALNLKQFQQVLMVLNRKGLRNEGRNSKLLIIIYWYIKNKRKAVLLPLDSLSNSLLCVTECPYRNFHIWCPSFSNSKLV